jgi:hypothetical protein
VQRTRRTLDQFVRRDFPSMAIQIFAQPIVLDSARLGAAVFREGVGFPEQSDIINRAARLRCHCDRNDSYARVCGGVRSTRFLMCAISTSDAFVQVLHAGRNARPRIMRNDVALSGFPHRSGKAWI